MKKIIIIILLLLFFPLASYAQIPKAEYVTLKTIEEVCGLGELLGCVNFKEKRILIYWKVLSIKEIENRIYYHEVGHWLTRKWRREDFINRFGYANINENDILTLSEKTANDFEEYNMTGIKDDNKIYEFKKALLAEGVVM